MVCELKLLQSLDTNRQSLSYLAIHTSGLVALGDYRTSDITLVDLNNGKTVAEYHDRDSTILGLFHADGDLYCVSRNYQELSASLVNFTSTKRTKLLTGMNFTAAACAYPIKVALACHTTIFVIELEVMRVAGELEGHEDSVGSMAFGRNGELLVSGGDGRVNVWDTDSLKCLKTLKTGETGGLSLSPDGDLLAVGRTSGRIDLWHLGGDHHRTFNTDSEYMMSAVNFDRQGQFLYTGRWDGRLFVWEIQRG
jgi:WD40 repeat protein